MDLTKRQREILSIICTEEVGYAMGVLAKLTRRQRDVVIARCRDGLTPDEVADRLFISRAVVRNHTNNVLHRLCPGEPSVDKSRALINRICYQLGKETDE